MLDNFKSEQKLVYNILHNSIINNKCSHAYLFETNGYKNQQELVISFVKSLLCPYNYTNNTKCKDCHQCENISKNIYPELKIINPITQWIKKDQLLELQKEFETKSIQSNKKIYIINNAEKLNDSSANSILKFLEEPSANIIAILVTDNIHQLLDTIVSRCQIISLSPNRANKNICIEEKIKNYLNIEYDISYLHSLISNVLNFINYLEVNDLNTLLYTKKLFLNNFIEKDDINTFFEVSILFYKDAINLKLNRKLDIFEANEYLKIIDKNNIAKLIKKIKILNIAKQNMKINENINLLIDKFILDMVGE